MHGPASGAVAPYGALPLSTLHTGIGTMWASGLAGIREVPIVNGKGGDSQAAW